VVSKKIKKLMVNGFATLLLPLHLERVGVRLGEGAGGEVVI